MENLPPLKTIWELCQEYRANMKCPYCFVKMNDGICGNDECEHGGKIPPCDHVILALPYKSLQGVKVGAINTEVLRTLKTVWVDKYGPFFPGSGRDKDAIAITNELEARDAQENQPEPIE